MAVPFIDAFSVAILNLALPGSSFDYDTSWNSFDFDIHWKFFFVELPGSNLDCDTPL